MKLIYLLKKFMKNNKVKYDLSIIKCCYNSSNFIENTLVWF